VVLINDYSVLVAGIVIPLSMLNPLHHPYLQAFAYKYKELLEAPLNLHGTLYSFQGFEKSTKITIV